MEIRRLVKEKEEGRKGWVEGEYVDCNPGREKKGLWTFRPGLVKHRCEGV